MAALFYYNGTWLDENPKLVGPADHSLFLASAVFDAARAIDGFVPDLENHCKRLIASAEAIGLRSPLPAEEIMELAVDGVGRMPNPRADIFIRPMMFAKTSARSCQVFSCSATRKLTLPCQLTNMMQRQGRWTALSTNGRDGRTLNSIMFSGAMGD